VIQTHYESDKKMRLFLSTLSTLLDEGKNFYTALREQSVVELPLFYVESIKVSEDGGILDEVLLELARFLKEQEKILLVGACLTCHKGNSEVMHNSLFHFDEVLKKRTQKCVLPDWK